MKFHRNIAIAASIAAMVAATPAFAQAFFTNSTGLSSPNSTVTFDEFTAPAGTAITNQYSAQGITFAGGYLNSQDGFFARNYLANFGNGGQSANLEFTFSNLVSGVAFDYVSNPGSSVFSVFNGATLVGTATYQTGYTPTFFGFSGASFNRVLLVAPGNGALEIGSVQFNTATAAVPEPATWGMMLVGFGMIGFGMRRRKSIVRTTVRFA